MHRKTVEEEPASQWWQRSGPSSENPAVPRLQKILDVTIVTLMIAIMLTLSLPVCMAYVEQKAVEQTTHFSSEPPSGSGGHGCSIYVTQSAAQSGRS